MQKLRIKLRNYFLSFGIVRGVAALANFHMLVVRNHLDDLKSLEKLMRLHRAIGYTILSIPVVYAVAVLWGAPLLRFMAFLKLFSIY